MLLTMLKGSILLLPLAGILFVPMKQTWVLRDFGDLKTKRYQSPTPSPTPKRKPKPPPQPAPPGDYSPIKGGHPRHSDGTYTVLEYPAKKEVMLTISPVTIPEATGIATILRDDDGTRIKLNLTNVPADISGMTLYAVDDTGTVTALGPIAISNGIGTLATTTPLTKFMLIASPETALTAYDPNTKVFFRSAVPEGFTVIPMRSSAEGEKVNAVAAPTTGTTVVTMAGQVATTYTAPLLGIPGFKKGDDTKIKVDFTGALTGARANVFVTPRKDGPTEVQMRFHDLKEAPAGQKFILWAVGPDGQFQKLGQVVTAPGRNEAEIKSETTLTDFGLIMTMESADADRPLGPAIANIHIVP